jgi:hypothetical protein
MATVYWTGGATAVAQVDTVSVTGMHGTPASTTYVLTVGSSPYTTTVSVAGDTDAATTEAALATAWNAATHPYCTGVTADSSGADVTLTADDAGLPFTVAASVTPASTAATGVLTLAANAGDTETVTLDAKAYTWQTVLTDVDGNVLIGASASDSIDNLIAAITGGAGAGSTYAASTTTHTTVTAAAGAGDTMDVTAIVAGTIGNAYATTETMANGSFGGGTLSGGIGGSISLANTTASAGPQDASSVNNYSGGALPGAADTFVIADLATNILFGLDAITASLGEADIRKTFTGKIGLDYMAFCDAADGSSSTTAKPEYRQTALNLDLADGTKFLRIGRHDAPGTPAGSGRIIIDLQTAGTVVVYATASQSADAGREAIRLSGQATDVLVRSGRGGVGLGTEKPSSALIVGTVYPTDPSNATRVITGQSCNITSWLQTGGNNVIDSTIGISTVTNDGGTLRTEGDFLIGTFVNGTELGRGGTSYLNHTKSGGDEVTVMTIRGGLVDGTQSQEPRTWATVNPDGGTLKIDDDVVTITTLDTPTGRYTLTVA